MLCIIVPLFFIVVNLYYKKSRTLVAFLRVFQYNVRMKCTLCPNACGVDREKKVGACGERGVRLAKYDLHFYEEPPISHKNGSGAVFFTGCALKCVFCQNYELSRSKRGKVFTPEELAGVFRELEETGAENINLVNPTHAVDSIIKALSIYRPSIPVVYNTHGYERVETLEKIDPFVDIYLPDMKFFAPEVSKRYTGKADYFAVAKKALSFMAKKPCVLREDGKMLSGVIVRHLVLPMNLPDTRAILRHLKETLPPSAYVSVMAQYTPFGEIANFPELQRPLTKREYERVVCEVESLAFPRLFLQERASASESFIPDWDY